MTQASKVALRSLREKTPLLSGLEKLTPGVRVFAFLGVSFALCRAGPIIIRLTTGFGWFLCHDCGYAKKINESQLVLLRGWREATSFFESLERLLPDFENLTMDGELERATGVSSGWVAAGEDREDRDRVLNPKVGAMPLPDFLAFDGPYSVIGLGTELALIHPAPGVHRPRGVLV